MPYLNQYAVVDYGGYNPSVLLPPMWPGLGTQQTAQEAVAIGSTAVGSTAAILAQIPGIIPSAAIPFIGPAIAAATLIVSILVKNSGCGQTCIQTSQWANQAAAALDQNSTAYFSQPIPRSESSRALALQNFDQIWAALTGPNNCGNPAMGNAGKRCITDRQRGACSWKQVGTPYPGGPQPGECFNWFVAYRDPIANDPNVVPDSALQSVTGSTASVLSAAGVPTSYAPYVLMALAAILVLGVVL